MPTAQYPLRQAWVSGSTACGPDRVTRKGVEYRLPTEAQWEYACRAGTTTAYSFGNDVSQLGEYACYADNSEGNTHPVGELQTNAWGLCDMHGNVYEWYQDRYGPYESLEVVSDPTGAAQGNFRVLRGGAFVNPPPLGRVADRNFLQPGFRLPSLGFRLARPYP